MTRLLTTVALLITLPVSSASAFTVDSAFTAGCHEQVTAAAFFLAAIDLPRVPDEAIPDGLWEDVLAHLYAEPIEDRTLAFMVLSLLVGVRAPDSEGHSLTNVGVLRGVQAHPDAQYIHCLRAEDDNFDEGNRTAMAECRATIIDSLVSASRFDPGELIEVPFTIDNYGSFSLEVSAIAYYLGRGLHTFQDSFSHTLRTPDLRQVVHVMNFEAAIAGHLDEDRDGMAHSSATDGCEAIGSTPGELLNRERVFAAIEASADLIRAFARASVEQRTSPDQTDAVTSEVAAVLLRWTSVADPADLGDYEVCNQANDYCDSPWLSLARIGPAGPILGCEVNHGAAPPGLGALAFSGLIAMAVWRRRRR